MAVISREATTKEAVEAEKMNVAEVVEVTMIAEEAMMIAEEVVVMNEAEGAVQAEDLLKLPRFTMAEQVRLFIYCRITLKLSPRTLDLII